MFLWFDATVSQDILGCFYMRVLYMIFTSQPLRAVRVFCSPMVSGWRAGVWVGGLAVVQAKGKSLSGIYLRNIKMYEVDIW